MLIYNITFNVDTQIEAEWLEWMKKNTQQKFLKPNTLVSIALKLTNVHPDTSGTTYAVQFTAMNITDVQQYLANKSAVLQNKLIAKFGQKVLLFMTLLEEV